MIGFIGGSGFDAALGSELGEPLEASASVRTKYGDATVAIYNSPGGNPVAFLARHGQGHSIAPHLINHHANIAALQDLGCRSVLSTTAVGSLRRDFHPGDLAVPDDFLDLRNGPPTTVYNTPDALAHTDFSAPFDPAARAALLAAANDAMRGQAAPDTIIHSKATYLCVSGPRYETPAEVRCFASWGADLVGMTVVPEAILARERDLAYATLSVITNYGAGISPSALSHEEVEATMRTRRATVVQTMIGACDLLAPPY